MKILGTIFLVVATIVFALGYQATVDNSSLGLQVKIASEALEISRDKVRAARALRTGEKADIYSIRNNEVRNIVARTVVEGARPNYTENEFDRSAKAEVAEEEEKYRRAVADREDKMKWHYVPAVCFSVLGLILLVVPTGRPKTIG